MKNLFFIFFLSLMSPILLLSNTEETITSVKDCCDSVEVTSNFTGVNSLGCCVYDITISNDFICNLFLYDGNGNIVGTVGPFSTAVISYAVCQGNNAVLFVGHSLDPNEACWKEKFACDPVDCCKDVSVNTTQVGINSQGCCIFKIEVNNKNECELYLYDENGNIISTIAPYTVVGVTYTVCPGNNSVVYVGPSINPDQACWKEELICQGGDCCKDVNVNITAIGTNPQGCCIYKVYINNKNNCELYFFDENGNVVTVIAPNSTATTMYTVCPGNSAVVYVGPSTNVDEACWKEELSCVSKDCCEKVDVNISLQGIDQEGCCVYKIVVTNNNSCKLYVYDDNGNIIGTLPPFTSALLSYTLCGGKSAVIYVGPSTNTSEACFKEEIICKQKDCCTDVSVNITNTGVDKEGCCVYKIVVTNSNDCKLYVFDNTGAIIGIVPPFTSSLLSYTVCPGTIATIFVGPSINKEEACYKETLLCAQKDCCKEVKVTTSFKGYDKEGCCVYQIVVTNNNSCKQFIYDSDGTIILVVPPFTSSIVDYTVCPGNSAVIYVGPNTIPDEACYKEELKCGKQGCCKNATFQTTYIGNDVQGCCIYKVVVSNPGECTLYIFDENGTIISTVPPMTSVLINYTVCQGNSEVIYVGASTDPDKACFKEELACENKNCCKEVQVSTAQVGVDDKGCCIFDITVSNNNECELNVFDNNGNVIAIVPGYASLVTSYTVCPGNNAIIYVGPSTDPDEACYKEELICESFDCCKGVEVDISYQGIDNKGCCMYDVTVVNDNDCKIFIFDSNGYVYTFVLPNSTLTLNISVCQGNSLTLFFGPSINPVDACYKEELICKEVDCCKDVKFEVNFLGFNLKGCCVYEVKISNPTDCVLYAYDNNGNIIAIIPPLGVIITNYTVCPGSSSAIYLGPNTNPNDACFKEGLNCAKAKGDADVEMRNGDLYDSNSIKVFPNPFNDNFKMEYVSTNDAAFKVSIYDIDGKIVRTLSGQLTKGNNVISLDNLQDLPSNLYFYRFESGDVNIYNKIIKQ